jgi:hypothetical protein
MRTRSHCSRPARCPAAAWSSLRTHRLVWLSHRRLGRKQKSGPSPACLEVRLLIVPCVILGYLLGGRRCWAHVSYYDVGGNLMSPYRHFSSSTLITGRMPFELSFGVGIPAREPSPRNSAWSSHFDNCAASRMVNGRTRTVTEMDDAPSAAIVALNREWKS